MLNRYGCVGLEVNARVDVSVGPVPDLLVDAVMGAELRDELPFNGAQLFFLYLRLLGLDGLDGKTSFHIIS